MVAPPSQLTNEEKMWTETDESTLRIAPRLGLSHRVVVIESNGQTAAVSAAIAPTLTCDHPRMPESPTRKSTTSRNPDNAPRPKRVQDRVGRNREQPPPCLVESGCTFDKRHAAVRHVRSDTEDAVEGPPKATLRGAPAPRSIRNAAKRTGQGRIRWP